MQTIPKDDRFPPVLSLQKRLPEFAQSFQYSKSISMTSLCILFWTGYNCSAPLLINNHYSLWSNLIFILNVPKNFNTCSFYIRIRAMFFFLIIFKQVQMILVLLVWRCSPHADRGSILTLMSPPRSKVSGAPSPVLLSWAALSWIRSSYFAVPPHFFLPVPRHAFHDRLKAIFPGSLLDPQHIGLNVLILCFPWRYTESQHTPHALL